MARNLVASICAGLGELFSLPREAANLASDHGLVMLALAEALTLSAARVRGLLSDVDQRPGLRLVGNEG